ncbi:MAG: biotin/lipoyl-containing protein [Dehalococcoidia bacterium]
MAKVTIGTRTYEVEVKGDKVVVDGHEFAVTVKDEGAHRLVNAGGVQYRVQLPAAEDRASGMGVKVDYRDFTMEWDGTFGGAPAPRVQRAASGAPTGAARTAVKGGVAAPIAGKVLRLVAKAGDAVKAGDVLLVLEAMKMENEIKAPVDGSVKEILVAEGARVSEGEVLAVVE